MKMTRRCLKSWLIHLVLVPLKQEDPCRQRLPKMCPSEGAEWLPELENCCPKARKVGCCQWSWLRYCHSGLHLEKEFGNLKWFVPCCVKYAL